MFLWQALDASSQAEYQGAPAMFSWQALDASSQAEYQGAPEFHTQARLNGMGANPLYGALMEAWEHLNRIPENILKRGPAKA